MVSLAIKWSNQDSYKFYNYFRNIFLNSRFSLGKLFDKHNWLALVIGNSRLHWAWFVQDMLVENWDTPHVSIAVEPQELPSQFLADSLIREGLTSLPVYLASVVTAQTKFWQNYPRAHIINLQDIKLGNLYPTLGIDRSLAAWGAVEKYNKSCLVIDGGTALTFTGVDQDRQLIGGAILPGLRSQFATLKQKTAALPEVEMSKSLPERWAMNTKDAIASGVIYSAIAGIYSYIIDWLENFPKSKIILTGGDGELLFQYLHLQYPETKTMPIITEYKLVFYGINLARKKV